MSPQPPADKARICLGIIVGARGLHGHVWIKSFAARPEDVGAYGALSTSDASQLFEIAVVDVRGDRVVARVAGVEDRTQAEALKGTRLFVSRAALPPAGDDEYYHADLIGLSAVVLGHGGASGDEAGRVEAVHDFGGGAVLEVRGRRFGTLMVPFTRTAVPLVDLAAGQVVIVCIPGLTDENAAEVSGADSQPETSVADADPAAVGGGRR